MNFEDVLRFKNSPEFFDFESDQLISLAVGMKIDPQHISDLEDLFETQQKQRKLEEDSH